MRADKLLLFRPLVTASPFRFIAFSLLLAAVGGRLWAASPVIDPPIPLEGEPARVEPEIPVGKTLLFPITASDADGEALSYKATSSNPTILVRVKTGNPKLVMNVTHADGGAGDPAYEGAMEFMLFRDWLPVSAGFVAGMAQAGFYDNVHFHRIADLGGGVGTAGFIFQGGDPLSVVNGGASDTVGSGGPGMTGTNTATAWKFQNEFHAGTIFTGRGQLAMANSGTYNKDRGYSIGSNGTLIIPDYLDSNGSQFFITDGQPRHLDFKHNVFAQMLRGWELLPKMRATKTWAAFPPVPAQTSATAPHVALKITSATVAPNETDAVLVLSAKARGSALITVTATDRSGAKATRSFTVNAVRDESNCNPFLRRLDPLVTPKDTPTTFGVSAVDLEFDYMEVEHSMVALSATLGAKGTALTQRGSVAQMQPTAAYTGLVKMGFDVRQFDIGGGGYQATSDSAFAPIGVGDAVARAGSVDLEAQPGLAVVNAVVGRISDTDPVGTPGNFTAKINWGDGTPLSVGTVVRDPAWPGANTYLALGGHTYARPGVYPIVVDFAGNAGATATSRGTAWVNSNPLRAMGVDVELTTARVVNRMVATFTDTAPGDVADYSVQIDWGDGGVSRGTVERDAGNGRFLVRGTHGYRDSEPFSARIRIHKANTPAASDAIAWATITPQFKAAQHLPPFPHGKMTIAWNNGPAKTFAGRPGPDYHVTYGGSFVIINTGNRELGRSILRFWLSEDRVRDAGDRALIVNGQPQLNIIPFPAGAGGSGQFVITLPKGESGARKYLLSEAVYSDRIADYDGSEKILVTGPLKPSILVASSGGLKTTEAGGKVTFTVVLDAPPVSTAAAGQPANDAVTIPLESSLPLEGAVSPAQLVFTRDNWFVPQTVTVTGVNDANRDGNKNYQINLKAALSGDALFSGIVGPSVSVTNLDNDP